MSNIAAQSTASSEPPAPDYAASLNFLRRFHPGRWLLSAIAPDKKSIVTATFDEARQDECRRWLELHGATRNLYFSLGDIAADLSSKASREKISAVRWLWCDVDTRAGEDFTTDRARILALLQSPPASLPPPSLIIDSGGGYWGLWKLSAPFIISGDLAIADEVEAYTRNLAVILDGDSCGDVARIARLPGTINRPDAGKAKRGRVPRLSTVVSWDDGLIHGIGRFTKAPPLNRPGKTEAPTLNIANVKRLVSVDELPAAVSARARVVIVQGNDPDKPFPSRSEALFFAVCEMVRGGCTDEQIFNVITDPGFSISASVLDKGSRVNDYAARQIQRARDENANFDANADGKPYQNQRNIRPFKDVLFLSSAGFRFFRAMIFTSLVDCV
jgi:hypothetical protein